MDIPIGHSLIKLSKFFLNLSIKLFDFKQAPVAEVVKDIGITKLLGTAHSVCQTDRWMVSD